jgi:hypothetical protein
MTVVERIEHPIRLVLCERRINYEELAAGCGSGC